MVLQASAYAMRDRSGYETSHKGVLALKYGNGMSALLHV